mmetsp:Transcript_109631/g.266516  ORF Transcript_109631/g.266516 Transcript_109631/m.266516 type:complete len:756 (-) Transcript_109631:54-2321(-)
MKLYMAAYAAALSMMLSASMALGARTSHRTSDRTITQVVKLLQDMLDKSKADGTAERELFAKHKCYCDNNEAAKKEEIGRLTEEIGLLESKIEELLSDSALLSKEVAQLKADMTANENARSEANNTRSNENADFIALETDLTDAIRMMNDAITTLSDIGADQSLGQAAADHQKFMANYQPATLLKLKTTVKQALLAASAVITKKQASSVQAFLQAPFTGTYTSQSSEVVGILKDMRDTFTANLATARATEAAAVEAHANFISTMIKAHSDMDASYQSKQGTLSTNDSTLSTKRTQLADAERQKGEATTFLEQLLTICTQKAREHQERTTLRTGEEAAIAEAISILNSDAAFETFGTVTATKTGPTAFFQSKSVQKHRHQLQGRDAQRQRAEAMLSKVAGSSKSMLLTKVAAMLAAGNPFATVLAEIEKMIGLLADEERADDEQLSWCTDERTTNNQNLGEKSSQITTLSGEINTLTQAIEAPETGLKAQILADETTLQTNIESQKTETQSRKEDNVAYQASVENLVEAETLLTKAVAVLRAYYSQILGGGSFVALASAPQPAPPPTWTGPYKGQSEHGGGDAISMLEFILQNTQQEEQQAHSAENTAQHAYEDSMQSLTDEEDTLRGNLATLGQSLAQKEEELLGKKADLRTTEEEKASIEAYLLQIKPGCDFITANITDRKANRQTEEAALRNAVTLLEGTPAYQEAVAAAHNETLGDCLSVCAGNEDQAECKACLAHVTVPAYCAGHAGTPGC